jgi:hypothetical protein
MRLTRGHGLVALAFAAPIAWGLVRASAPDPDLNGAYAAALGFAASQVVEADHALCVSIDTGAGAHDPAEALLTEIHFRGEVVKGSQCRTQGEGVTLADSGARAVVLTVLSMKPVAEGEVWIDVRHFRTPRFSGIRTYRVVRQADRWVALGQIVVLDDTF